MDDVKASPAVVYREGRLALIAPTNIVLGDLLVVQSEDMVPADMIIVHDYGEDGGVQTRLDYSCLIGDPEPRLLRAGQGVAFGSLMNSGAALGLVTAIGDSTLMGSIASEYGSSDDSSDEEQPLNGKRVNKDALFSCCEELRLKEVGLFFSSAVAALARLAHKGGQEAVNNEVVVCDGSSLMAPRRKRWTTWHVKCNTS